jgi:acetyltransferase-like isoleucine patch superfamily enzyme
MTFESSPEISALARIGRGVKVWAFSKICDDVQIGENTIVGRSVYIGPGVQIGANCKIQNGALLYEPAELGNGVFVGPGVILTNDLNPRAVTPKSEIKTQADWIKQGVTIDDGASIGAGSICVSPVKIGKWVMVGAGSVVIRDIPDFAIVVGNPAIQIGWTGRSGFRLREINSKEFICDQTDETYRLIDGKMILMEIGNKVE